MDFLVANLNAGNCFRARELAYSAMDAQLGELVDKFVLENFSVS